MKTIFCHFRLSSSIPYNPMDNYQPHHTTSGSGYSAAGLSAAISNAKAVEYFQHNYNPYPATSQRRETPK